MYLTRDEFGESWRMLVSSSFSCRGLRRNMPRLRVAMRVTSSSMSEGRSIRCCPSLPIQLSAKVEPRCGVAMYTMRVTLLDGEKMKLFWSCSSVCSSQFRGASPFFQFPIVMPAKVSGGSSKIPFISVQGLVELLKRVMRPPMECPTMTMLFISLDVPRGLYSCMSSFRACRCLLAGMVQASPDG